MKLSKYIAIAALPVLLWGCKEEPVLPPVNTFTPNTSIIDLKTSYWQNDANYVSTIGQNADGEDIVIKGRVISSDATGNIYKSLVISDGTAAITIAANAYDMYQTFAFGQEVYMKVTGLEIGGYNNLMQLGGEGTYNNAPSMTFMTEDNFRSHIQGIGHVDAAAVDTIVTDLDELTNAKATQEGMIAWQSQLIRLDGMTFEDAGQQFAPSGNTNRYLKDANGKRINLRCSSYSDFAKENIPSGTGSVTGILSYYGQDWQMLLIDLEGLQGFAGGGDTPDIPDDGKGSKESPYTVSEVIALGNPGSKAWVTGYIVGVMNFIDGPGNVFSATELTTNSNIVLAATATDYGTSYIAVQLPNGSELRTSLNLVDNPGLVGKEISILGNLNKYCGIAGLKECSMAIIDGKEIGQEPAAPGEGVKFTLASSIESGAVYALWAENKVAKAVEAAKDFGYIYVADCTPSGSEITAEETNGFLFTQTDKGWTIQQTSDNRYLFMTGTFNSFNLSDALDDADNGFYWEVKFDASGTTITNAGTGKTIQYSSQYTSYGSYSDMRGSFPVLYKK